MIIASAHPCTRPPFIPMGRARGAKAQGLVYERKFAKFFTGALHGQWFEYTTVKGNGKQWCQTDFLVSYLPAAMLVLELKYSFVHGAATKLKSLYVPVVQRAFEVPTFGAVVVKNVTQEAKPIVYSLEEAVEVAKRGPTPILHWVGQPV